MIRWLMGERAPKTDERMQFLFAAFVVAGTGVMAVIVVIGCFILVTRRYEIDQALLAICTGLISSILTGASANVQQIISYYFNQGKKANGPNQPPVDPAGTGPDRQHAGAATVGGSQRPIDQP